MQALRDAGLLQMMFPRNTGGVDRMWITQVQTVDMLVRGCPRTAWAYGVLSSVTASAASMPQQVRQLVVKNCDELVCSVAVQKAPPSRWTAAMWSTEAGATPLFACTRIRRSTASASSTALGSMSTLASPSCRRLPASRACSTARRRRCRTAGTWRGGQ